MILGSVCTRNCSFCNVTNGHAEIVDPHEPQNLAEAVMKLKLNHVVITSVTRDDLEDCGARHFANTIKAVRELNPNTTIEVLIPDLKGLPENLDIIINAKPDVINHNIETIKSLYKEVRPQANYERSLFVLEYVKKEAPSIFTKTGIMVGLGEKDEEVYELMDDCLNVNCDILTIGQYLRPSEEHIKMVEYVRPEKFEEYKKVGLEKGFSYIASSPLVRSSYKAEEALRARSN
jgi:lipoic acid synthetase